MKKGIVITDFTVFKKVGGLENLRDEINRALEAIGFKYGIKISAGRCSYAASFAEYKLVASVISESGLAETKESQEFRQLAHLLGLKPEMLWNAFYHKGHNYTIIGMRNGRKNPVLARRQDNREFFFPVAMIKAFKLKPVAA